MILVISIYNLMEHRRVQAVNKTILINTNVSVVIDKKALEKYSTKCKDLPKITKRLANLKSSVTN